MAFADAGTHEAARLRPRHLRQQYVVARRSRHSRHEHGAVVHESAWQSDARSSGEQQFLFHQHQHRTGRLRVVRRPRRLLGSHSESMRKEQYQLSARLVVAQYRRFDRREYPRLPIPATPW